MASALEAIDAALDGVARQAQSLRRGTTRQVKTGDERDALKALAYSWLQSFRNDALSVFTDDELVVIDGTFRGVLDSSARYSARTTFLDQLKAARDDLIELRSRAAGRAPRVAATTPGGAPPPAFAALAPDARMQAILIGRWQEIERCMAAGAALAATVMMGGLLESLLLSRINKTANKKPIFTARTTPKSKTTGAPLPLNEWTLASYIEVCHELKWITKSARDVGSVLREFRNYIHPHKEFTDAVTISVADAEMFWAVTRSITQQVLESTKTPPL
jgi:hypothetical protein